MKLRPYQQECVDLIDRLDSGSYLVQMATGMGKSFTFASIPRKGRVLILSHRQELVAQPQKYYDCSFGVEQGNVSSHGEEVVSASVQSLARRLDRFHPNAFDMIITDEAHHAAAKTYRQIYDYFQPRLHIGFTATPNRGDNVRLDNVFEDIIFQRDLKWGIKEGYLSDIHCLRVNIGFDLSHVARRMGDYAPGQLDEAMNIESQNKAIAEAYYNYAKGQTLIFATSVEHAENIAKEIKGAVVVSAKTKNRQAIIDRFTRREIPVLVNCMIFTEGTDIPLIETIIIARPTQNASLYTQMVGRGLRLSEGKEKLTLIDCVGISGKVNLCTAPTLIGLDVQAVPSEKQDEIQGDLFDLPRIITQKADTPESWIRNVELVNLWAKEQQYQTHQVNYFKMPDGSFVCNLPKQRALVIKAQDELGMTLLNGKKVPMQQAFDRVYRYLKENHSEEEAIWNLNIAKKWGTGEATEKQKNLIARRVKDFDTSSLTKLQASHILNRVMYS